MGGTGWFRWSDTDRGVKAHLNLAQRNHAVDWDHSIRSQEPGEQQSHKNEPEMLWARLPRTTRTFIVYSFDPSHIPFTHKLTYQYACPSTYFHCTHDHVTCNDSTCLSTQDSQKRLNLWHSDPLIKIHARSGFIYSSFSLDKQPLMCCLYSLIQCLWIQNTLMTRPYLQFRIVSSHSAQKTVHLGSCTALEYRFHALQQCLEMQTWAACTARGCLYFNHLTTYAL